MRLCAWIEAQCAEPHILMFFNFLPISHSSIFITKFNMVSEHVNFRSNVDLLPHPSAVIFYFKGLLSSLDSIKNLYLSPLQTHFESLTSWSNGVCHISCWRTYCLEHSVSFILISLILWVIIDLSLYRHSLHYLNIFTLFLSCFFYFGPHVVKLYILQYV